jgi:hypothetical protein
MYATVWRYEGVSDPSEVARLGEVGLSLLLGVCGLFFLDDLQTIDHLECEAHDAALLPLCSK